MNWVIHICKTSEVANLMFMGKTNNVIQQTYHPDIEDHVLFGERSALSIIFYTWLCQATHMPNTSCQERVIHLKRCILCLKTLWTILSGKPQSIPGSGSRNAPLVAYTVYASVIIIPLALFPELKRVASLDHGFQNPHPAEPLAMLAGNPGIVILKSNFPSTAVFMVLYF